MTKKKITFSIFISSAVVLFFAIEPISGQTLIPTISAEKQTGQNKEINFFNDFNNDIQVSLSALSNNSYTQTKAEEIKSEDYKSTYDEFGASVLIDGTTPPNEVDKEITKDILQTVQTEENYDKQESDYLTNAHIAPEEIQTTEEQSGLDFPSDEPINPQPSLEANPGVNPSAVENVQEPTQNNSEENTSPPEVTPSQPSNSSSAPEQAATPNGRENLSVVKPTESNNSVSEVNTPHEKNMPSDNTIFEAILESEKALVQTPTNKNTESSLPSEETSPPAEPPPAEPPPQ